MTRCDRTVGRLSGESMRGCFVGVYFWYKTLCSDRLRFSFLPTLGFVGGPRHVIDVRARPTKQPLRSSPATALRSSTSLLPTWPRFNHTARTIRRIAASAGPQSNLPAFSAHVQICCRRRCPGRLIGPLLAAGPFQILKPHFIHGPASLTPPAFASWCRAAIHHRSATAPHPSALRHVSHPRRSVLIVQRGRRSYLACCRPPRAARSLTMLGLMFRETREATRRDQWRG